MSSPYLYREMGHCKHSNCATDHLLRPRTFFFFFFNTDFSGSSTTEETFNFKAFEGQPCTSAPPCLLALAFCLSSLEVGLIIIFNCTCDVLHGMNCVLSCGRDQFAMQLNIVVILTECHISIVHSFFSADKYFGRWEGSVLFGAYAGQNTSE